MSVSVKAVSVVAAVSWLALAAGTSFVSAMAQENQAVWQSWLGHASVAPDFQPPATRRGWESKRAGLRKQLGELLGKLPPRPASIHVRTLSREDRGDYWLEKFEFDNRAGATVPGYLLAPRTAGRHPALLFCHQHGGLYEKGGKEELFQTAPAPVPAGPALVKLGYVVIAIDAYCFGERAGRGPAGPAEKGAREELTASKFNLWVGRTLWGMILRDDLMALDYLVSRPEVDSHRIGVTGFSMGATRSWWLTALDDRLKAGVPVACLTRYQELIAHEALPAHGIYYFVPGMLNHFDTEAVIAMAAPRPMLFMTGDQDGGSPADGIRKIENAVKPVYRLYARESDFKSVLFPGLGHKYLPEMWENTLSWFERHLEPGRILK